jgi:hypothetical protein
MNVKLCDNRVVRGRLSVCLCAYASVCAISESILMELGMCIKAYKIITTA